jgi:hypothetical protein
MATIHELVDEWRAMKGRLEQQLETLDEDVLSLHAPFTKDTIRRWVVELDDLIIKYSFPV